jgi:hypothetical protein
MQKGFTAAVSTILAVLLILAAAILGGLVSYMWAIAPFYSTPTNVGLAVTGASFQAGHANYFDVTVLNPSNSQGGTNITSICLEVTGKTSLFNVTDTNPGLPIFLDQGASTTVRCYSNWGSYAGNDMTVEVFSQAGTGSFLTVQTKFVKLTAVASFNATESVEYFYVVAKNDPVSEINLTVTGVSIDSIPVSNISKTLPITLSKGESVVLQCFSDWQEHATPDVKVETQEQYVAEVTQNVSASAFLQVNSVEFSETNQGQVAVTISSSSGSTTAVDISSIAITHGNTTDVINETISSPSFPILLYPGNSTTFNCPWDWSDESHRNLTISVAAYTSQGFVSQSSSFTTPAEVAARIDQAEFDLNDTGHFNVTTANLPYSLQTINVTGIDFNGSPTGVNSELVAADGHVALVCSFNWSSFIGQKAYITANVTYGANNSLSLPPFQVSVPYFSVLNVSFADSSLGNPYVNVTVRNSELSKSGANITDIFILSGNATQSVDGTLSNPPISPLGYLLASGGEITIVCPWNWSAYAGGEVAVTVQAADGFQASMTLKV